MTPVSSAKSTPQVDFAMQQRFEELPAEWHQAAAHHSASKMRHNLPAYQAIIALGPPVVPLLLQDLAATRHS
jgi:hypothetical protein